MNNIFYKKSHYVRKLFKVSFYTLIRDLSMTDFSFHFLKLILDLLPS